MGAVHLPFLLSFNRCAAPLVALVSRLVDSRRPARLSRHLLLLSQGLLSRLLPRSAGLRRQRKRFAQISRRNRVSVPAAKPAPLFFLPRDPLPLLPLVRRHPRLPLPRRFRHRRGVARDAR